MARPVRLLLPFWSYCIMKISALVLLASAGVAVAQPATETNSVVVTTELVNRLIAEARTNNPALRAADSRVRSAELNAQSIRTWEDPSASFGGSVYSEKGFK